MSDAQADDQATKAPVTESPKLGKAPWQSKTLWLSAITSVVPLFNPYAAQMIHDNPTLFSFIVGALFFGLRTISGSKIDIG